MEKRNMYKVGIYLRLSRDDGDNVESHSITNQRDLLLKFLKSTSENLVYIDQYIDDGYSGSNFDRPDWKRLMHDINNKKIDTIITKDLSRMGRDYIYMGQLIEREFPEKNIRYIALDDDIDTLYETPGLDFLQFKLVFNDLYLKDASKKVRRIITSKKEDGKYLGWKGIYGYKRDPNDKHKLIVDENVRHIVVKMFNLSLQGYSPLQIANIFSQEKIPTPSIYANLHRGVKSSAYSLWCPRTIEELLINPTYIGHMTQGKRKKINYKSKKEIRVPMENWIIVENTHEAIIDKETFYTVQNLLKKNKHKHIRNKNYLLTGFLRCKECGHVLTIRNLKEKDKRYTSCSFYHAYSKFKVCSPHCNNYDKLEASVINNLKEICFKYVDVKLLEEKLKKELANKNEKHTLLKKLNDIKIKENQINISIDKIYTDRLDGTIDIEMYNRNTLKYKEQLKSIQKEKLNIESCLTNFVNSPTEEDNDAISKKVMEFLSFKKPTRSILANLIDNIYVDKNKNIEIHYKFKVY